MKVSKSFETFIKEAPEVQKIWMDMVENLDKAISLDNKVKELSYISVLAATGLKNGLPFHVSLAKSQGATRDEIISSVLLGLPAVGNKVVSALPIALKAYDDVE
jgi:alkylhydroperoxidase/carboxymuconolactone decarboxylase family protein YurZ